MQETSHKMKKQLRIRGDLHAMLLIQNVVKMLVVQWTDEVNIPNIKKIEEEICQKTIKDL